MKAKAALIAAAMTAAVVSGAWSNQYRFHVAELIDSDTYRGVVTLWPGMTLKVDIRVNGIDTPEHYRPAKECREHERALAAAAKKIAAEAIEAASEVRVTRPFPGKYAGRAVADVILVDERGRETSIADLLLESGLAVPYDGGTKTKDWCAVSAP